MWNLWKLRKPAARQGEVAHCERSENRGSWGGAENMDDFEAILHLIRVATAVDFEADVPGGNWVTVGYRFLPGARLWGCKGGRNEGGGRRVRIGVPGRGV